MKIEYIANSGAIYSFTNGVTMLLDPWFACECNQTWFPFPPVPREYQTKINEQRFDLLYISHLHSDHLHPETLESISKETQVIIGKLNTPHLKNRMKALGFHNIVELPLRETCEVKGVKICIFADFNKTTLGHSGDLDYDLDTSIYVWDPAGTSLFNCIDNTILPKDAEEIKETYGAPTACVLPYASASLYPMAMTDYSDEKKREITTELKKKFASIFHECAQIFGSSKVIPAGGEYVLGAESASHSKFMPAPTLSELLELGGDKGITRDTYCKLYQGDILDLSTGHVTINEGALLRNYSSEDFVEYAKSTGWQKCKYRSLKVPKEIELTWSKLCHKAAMNFTRNIKRVGVEIDREIIVDSVPVDEMEGEPFSFLFDVRNERYEFSHSQIRSTNPHVRFTINQKLLLLVFLGSLNWNNLESSCLIGVERNPDEYLPNIHECMVFFSL